MSSTEDELDDGNAESTRKYLAPRPILSNKRKVQRACDNCRQKKSNGGTMLGNRCSSCLAQEIDCTYLRGAKKRGPPKGYIENLHNRVESIEALLQKLLPEADLDVEIGLVHPDDSPTTARLLKPSTHVVNRDGRSEHGRFGADNSLLLGSAGGRRFFGDSSSALFVKEAFDLKTRFERSMGLHERNDFHPLGDNSVDTASPSQPTGSPPSAPQTQAQLVFPEDDLLHQLLDLYFEQFNIVFPLLHRPSFEQKIAEGLHYEDDGFATVLLVVCAMGSRLTDDRRVLLDPTTPLSAGWKWFNQVQVVRKSLFRSPTLHDIQTYILTAHFLTSTSAPHACWTLIGIAVRLVQDIGLHRWRFFSAGISSPLERELWKRAWWNIVIFDRNISSVAGRPCNLAEDHDVDLPERSDDQYLDDNESNATWRPPPNTPSRMDYFIHNIKLYQILYLTLNSMYCVDRSKLSAEATDPDWEKNVVAELDAELNHWGDNIPEHLRRNAGVNAGTWHWQSISLYAQYYYLQILLHRPLINTPDGPSFADLAVCVNAARACSHLVDVHKHPYQLISGPIQVPVFTSAVVLLLNIWGGRRSKASGDPSSDMSNVHQCMSILKVLEKKWQIAGRLWDIIHELAAVGDIPLPIPAPTKKRSREAVPLSQSSQLSPSTDRRVSGREDASRVYASLPKAPRSSTGSSLGSMEGKGPQPDPPQAHYHPQPSSHSTANSRHTAEATQVPQTSYYNYEPTEPAFDRQSALEWPPASAALLPEHNSRSTSDPSNSFYDVHHYPTDPLQDSSSGELTYQTQLQPGGSIPHPHENYQQQHFMPGHSDGQSRLAPQDGMFDEMSMWDRAPIGQSEHGSWETFMANPSGGTNAHLGYGYPRG